MCHAEGDEGNYSAAEHSPYVFPAYNFLQAQQEESARANGQRICWCVCVKRHQVSGQTGRCRFELSLDDKLSYVKKAANAAFCFFENSTRWTLLNSYKICRPHRCGEWHYASAANTAFCGSSPY